VSKPTARKYSGILLKPMEQLDPHEAARDIWPIHLLDAGDKRMIGDKRLDDLAERMEALFQHYNVPLRDWRSLALALAVKHVPGFSVRPPKRKKRIETLWHLRMFHDFVMKTLREKPEGTSESQVLYHLYKDAEFQRIFPALAKAKPSRLANLMAKARKRMQDDPGEWDPPEMIYATVVPSTHPTRTES
jgi:hypothetical protein